MNITEILSKFNREDCLVKANKILDDCDIYHQTEYGMNKIFDTWASQKSKPIWDGKSIMEILSQHPNYIPEKGYIVFDNNFDRPLDIDTIDDVLNDYINSYRSALKEKIIPPFSYGEIATHLNNLCRIINRLDSFDEYLGCYGNTYPSNLVTYKGRDYNYYASEKNRFCKLRDNYEDNDEIFIDYTHEKAYSRDDIKKSEDFKVVIQGIKSWIHNHKEETSLLADDFIIDLVKSKTNIDVHKGTKLNKVISRICKLYGMDKHEYYNKWSARLGDAISPVQFKRKTVVSINPIDYWTMSYGDHWCSCQNIDKNHNRLSSQEGMYGDGCSSSGTESYMLDSSTIVMYTVSNDYNGTDFELQDKINRCLFHVGESKFIMGRVYPQGTDGADAVYKQWRAIMQSVLSTCVGAPNYWKLEKDVYLKRDQIISKGTHYTDYTCSYCNVAGWAWLKPNADSTFNPTKIVIGHDPICPSCGCEHSDDSSIECDHCFNEHPDIIGYCRHCGDPIYDGDYGWMLTAEGNYYCGDYCAESEGIHWCEDDSEYHESNECFMDSYTECWYSNNALEVETEDGNLYSSFDNAYDDGYNQDYYGCWYPEDELLMDSYDDELFHPNDFEDYIEIGEHCFRTRENAEAFGYHQNGYGDWIYEDDEEEEEAI